MKRTMLGLLAAAAMISTVPTYAHHSFAATYFEDKTQSVEGDLVQFLFRNPHSFVHVEAPDEKGVMQRWAIVFLLLAGPAFGQNRPGSALDGLLAALRVAAGCVRPNGIAEPRRCHHVRYIERA